MEEIKLDSTGFPSVSVPPAKRDNKWYLAMGREIWRRHQALMADVGTSFHGMTGTRSGVNTRNNMRSLSKANELRRMAAGAQSTARLVQKYELAKGQDGNSQTSMNEDWSPVAMAKKYVNLFVQFLMEPGYEPDVKVFDPSAMNEKRIFKAERMAKIATLEWQNANMATLGLQQEEIPEGMPRTFEELDVYMELGGYKNMLADAMERLVKFVQQDNSWDAEIFPQIVREFAAVGLVGLSNYTTEDNRIKYNVIPIERLVLPYIERGWWDSSKIPYIGEIRKMTRDELYRVAGDTFTPEQYKSIMEKSRAAVVDTYNPIYSSYEGSNDRDLYVEVLFWQFFAMDSTTYKVRETVNGAKVEKMDDDWEPTNNPKVKKESECYRQVYEGYWIVGTEHVFCCGKASHVPRQANNDHETRLHIDVFSEYTVNMVWRSAVSAMQEFVKKIDECWLQVGNQLGHVIPPGVRADVMAMAGTSTPKDMAYRVLKQTGNIEFNSKFTMESGIPIAGKDLVEIHAGFFPDGALVGLFTVIRECKSMLEDMIGFNDATNAGTASPEALVRVQQQQAQGTVRSTAYAVEELRRGIRSSCWSVMGRIQSVISSGKHWFTEGVGGITMEVVSRLGDMPMTSMGMDVVVGANQAEKIEIEEYIKVGIANQQIMPWDAMLIRSLPTYRAKISMLKVIWKRSMKQMQEQQQMAQQMELQKIAEANKGQAELLQIKSQLHIQEQMAAMDKKFQDGMAMEQFKQQKAQENLAAEIQAGFKELMMKIDGQLRVTELAGDKAIEREEEAGETKEKVQRLANERPAGAS